MRERIVWMVVVVALVVYARRPPRRTVVADRPAAPPGVRLTMSALHQQGGVPLGWQLTPPPGDVAAGRRAFADLGCATCHRVAGDFETAASIGPDLSGMGGHHPPAYFVEAILNPDAVLVDGAGAVGADGRSTMPAYPDITVGDLVDLTAYLASLRDDGTATGVHVGLPPAITVSRLDLRESPPPHAGVFFAQSYDVRPGQLAALEAWFDGEGRRAFSAVDGLLAIDTYVDLARPGAAVTSLFAFRNETALRNFLGDPGSAALWNQLDGFIGPHGHLALDRPLIYRAPTLSYRAPTLSYRAPTLPPRD